MRFLLTAFLLPVLAGAAILPDAIGAAHRTAVSRPALTDRGVWDEYGLRESETATYEGGDSKFTVTAYRLQDTTGALAAFDWQRPALAKPSSVAAHAVETADSLLVLHANILLWFGGYKPAAAELTAVQSSLRNLDETSLPTLPGYLPSADLLPNSERYITGPIALQKFVPGIPPSVAAFRMGAEIQTGVFHTPKGDLTLAIFNYPTPQIAMQKVGDFGKLGAMVKRSGPLVAVILAPPDADAAERLLGQVRYQAEVTRDEYVPGPGDNMGVILTNIFILIGVLILFALASGLAWGGSRLIMRRLRHGEEPEAMITLHLQ